MSKRKKKIKGVYLLHFQSPYRHARHYIGYSPTDILKRIEADIAGKGARLCQVVAGAGITIVSARIWPEKDRSFERRLKNRKDAKNLCPICNPRSSHRNEARGTAIDPDVDL